MTAGSMDLVASIFRLTNARFLMAPKFTLEYLEEDTGNFWHVTAGGSRAYLLRFGKGLAAMESDSIDKQNADSHFMMSRVQCGFLVDGKGLFQAQAVGRIFLGSIQDKPNWFTQLDLPTSKADAATPTIHDWIKAMSKHTILRRAATDAHLALSYPHEAGAFVYRGFEWLLMGEGRGWEDLAADIGVSKSDVRDFKKLANVGYGVRHASRSGEKLRANIQNYGTWVCGLIDAINATRARIEPGYKVAAPETVAEAVAVAMPLDPYP